jgi:TolB protein
MPHKPFRLSGLLVLILMGISLLGACGDSGPTYSLTLATPSASASANGSPGAAATTAAATTGSDGGAAPTSTPVIINTPAAATTAAATVAPTGATATSPTPRATATPRAFQSPQGFTGKLALLGPDNALYIAKFDGSQPVVVLGSATAPASATQDGEVIQWPTWSKDGTRLAAMSLNIKSGQVDTADIVVTDGDGKNPVKVRQGVTAPPVFISWSPDGNLLSVLGRDSSSSTVLALHLLDTSKNLATTKPADRKVAEGAAVYTGWSPDSQQLLIHTSTSANDSALALLAAKDSQAQPTALKVTPSLFRSPAFSADGLRRAFAVINSPTGNEDVVLQDKDGNDAGKLDSGGKNASFSWSPADDKLAFSIANTTSQGLYKGIMVLEVDPKAPSTTLLKATQVVSDDVAAFFWSPDGKKLAYVTLNEAGDMLVWKMYDFDSKKNSTITEWFPSETWGQLINFFDQYAQTNSIWSPDSKALVFAGLSAEDYTAATESNSADSLQPQVYILPVDGTNAGKALAVGYGSLAFWSK